MTLLEAIYRKLLTSGIKIEQGELILHPALYSVSNEAFTQFQVLSEFVGGKCDEPRVRVECWELHNRAHVLFYINYLPSGGSLVVKNDRFAPFGEYLLKLLDEVFR